MDHPKFATPDHPIQDSLSRRWSPYAFADRPVSTADLCSLFEAARWAASSFNEQPWRYIVATKSDPDQYASILSCLVEQNQQWASGAPVLAIGCVMLRFAYNNKPNSVAIHDLGLASGNLSAEATARGLVVHQMAGILPDRITELYGLPQDVQPITALAIGYASPPDQLPEALRTSELTPRTRRPLSEFVFGGRWGLASNSVSQQ